VVLCPDVAPSIDSRFDRSDLLEIVPLDVEIGEAALLALSR